MKGGSSRRRKGRKTKHGGMTEERKEGRKEAETEFSSERSPKMEINQIQVPQNCN